MSSKPPNANIAFRDTHLDTGGGGGGEGGGREGVGEVHVYAERGAEVTIHHEGEEGSREGTSSTEPQLATKKV